MDVITAKFQVDNLNIEDISDVKVSRVIDDNVFEFISGDYNENNIKSGYYSLIDSGDSIGLICGVGRVNNDIVITYKVKDRVILHDDCAEINLKLLNSKMLLNCNKINRKNLFS